LISDLNFGGRYAVTMFSFMNEILAAKQTTNEIMTECLQSGISKVVEIDAPIHFRSFPDISDAEISAFRDIIDAQGATLATMGAFSDRAISRTEFRSNTELKSLLNLQLQAVKKLGGTGIRIGAGMIEDELLEFAIHAAEDLDLCVMVEIQGTQLPDSEVVTKLLELNSAVQSPAFSLLMDTSAFMGTLPPDYLQALERSGITNDQISEIHEHWGKESLNDLRGWLVGKYISQNISPLTRGLLLNLISRFGWTKPADWRDIYPLVKSVQLKFWDLTDGDQQLSKPMKELVSELAAHNYHGDMTGEWGGHEWHTLKTPALEALRWHRRIYDSVVSEMRAAQ
jgi:hypothetical protein